MSTIAHTPDLQQLDVVKHSDGQPDQPDCRPDYQPDYINIAIPLVERGFRVTPVHPQTKMGVMRNWQKHQATTVKKVLHHAKYYPHHNVGVVGTCGVGHHCFLDIDADGVLDRIEAETGCKMPRTYTVCSRPDSAPYKRHYYFKQTMYSFHMFGGWNSKNINVRDMTRRELSRSGLMLHPTLYDVKGIGGGSLVVGAGSIRDTGEVYRCIDESPVIPIPDWLVDWLIADSQKFVLAKDEENKQKLADKTRAAAAVADKERAELRRSGNPEGFDIYEEDIYDFLRWRASSLSGLGLSGDSMIPALTALVVRSCENGTTYVNSPAGQEKIKKVANEKRYVGHARWFYKRGREKCKGLVVTVRKSKTAVIKEIVQTLPDRIHKHDALERINSGLEAAGLPFHPRADRNKLLEVRKAVRFTVSGCWWEKRQDSLPDQCGQTDSGTGQEAQ